MQPSPNHFNDIHSHSRSDVTEIFGDIMNKPPTSSHDLTFDSVPSCSFDFLDNEIFCKSDESLPEDPFSWCWFDEPKYPEHLNFLSEDCSNQLDTHLITGVEQSSEPKIVDEHQTDEKESIVQCFNTCDTSNLFMSCPVDPMNYINSDKPKIVVNESKQSLDSSSETISNKSIVDFVGVPSEENKKNDFKLDNYCDNCNVSVDQLSSDAPKNHSIESEISETISSELCQESEDIFQQLMAEYNCIPQQDNINTTNFKDTSNFNENTTGFMNDIQCKSQFSNHDLNASNVQSANTHISKSTTTVPNIPTSNMWPSETVTVPFHTLPLPNENILTFLTNDLLNTTNASSSYETGSGMLQTVYDTSHWIGPGPYFQAHSNPSMPASDPLMTFLSDITLPPPPPPPAPAIPCLPDTLVSRVSKKENKVAIKFKKSYRRTTSSEPKLEGSYVDMIGVEHDEQCVHETKIKNDDFLSSIDTHQLPDIPPPRRQKTSTTQQINVRVFKRIKSDIEKDQENRRNFSGFVVSDASCFVNCKPSSGHRKPSKERSPCEEINIGTLSSCRKLGQVRKVRTEGGDEVVIISPRPKYRMSSTKTRNRINYVTSSSKATMLSSSRNSQLNGVVEGTKKETVDMDVVRACKACNRYFKNGKSLVTHILKIHSR